MRDKCRLLKCNRRYSEIRLIVYLAPWTWLAAIISRLNIYLATERGTATETHGLAGFVKFEF